MVAKRVPIIAMTANAMKGDRERCPEAGMDDYLAKPVNPDELMFRIKRWLSLDGRAVVALPQDRARVSHPQANDIDNEVASAYDFKGAPYSAMGDVSFFKTMLNEFRQNQEV